MKRLFCLTALLGMAYSVWADNKEVLVGKCTYGYSYIAGDKKGRITPGDPFVYFVKINDDFFAISGIAHKEDFIREKTQPLREDLPLLKIFQAGSVGNRTDEEVSQLLPAGSMYWIQPHNRRYGHVPIPLYPQADEVIETARAGGGDAILILFGRHPLTGKSYPACSYWKH